MIPFSSRRRQDREAAERLYAKIVEQARQPFLYESCGVPDTLDGRFEMMALHLFVVTDRLTQCGKAGAGLARLVSETFVSDMDAAFREMGVGDLTVPKRIKTLYRSFAGRMMAYRQGIEGGRAELEAALARNVFPDGDRSGGAPRLAAYLRGSADALAKLGLAELRAGQLAFPPPQPVRSEEHA